MTVIKRKRHVFGNRMSSNYSNPFTFIPTIPTFTTTVNTTPINTTSATPSTSRQSTFTMQGSGSMLIARRVPGYAAHSSTLGILGRARYSPYQNRQHPPLHNLFIVANQRPKYQQNLARFLIATPLAQRIRGRNNAGTALYVVRMSVIWNEFIKYLNSAGFALLGGRLNTMYGIRMQEPSDHARMPIFCEVNETEVKVVRIYSDPRY